MTIRIPNTERKFSQPNNSDLFGNIHYTKSINFDEEGYLKLSPRTLSFYNDADDTDFGLVLGMGRETLDSFRVVTDGEVFRIQINNILMGASRDTDNDDDPPPSPTLDSHGVWFQNLWHVSDATTVVSQNPSNNDWTDRITGLTSGKIHCMEVFRSRNELCVSNGNTVKEYNTSYSNTVTLTIPSDFEITGLAYSKNTMGIATKLSDAADGQNGEAYFFTWDGSSTSAEGGFPVGSDTIVSVKAYKSSFLLLTRTGELLYFNGGGFKTLLALPHYYLDKTWGDSTNLEAFRDVIQVDGDVIYLNINTEYETFGSKGEKYITHAPGGVLCYDQKVGLYNRFSPSVSKIGQITVTDANVNTSTDTMTFTYDADFIDMPATGNPIKYLYNGSSPIGGLSVGKVYFIIKKTATTFQVASSYENAMNNIAIDLTSSGASNNIFMCVALKDYGASVFKRTGAIALPEKNTETINTLLFSGELFNTDDTSDAYHLCFPCTGFRNIGYVVTPKILSNDIEDIFKYIYIKYRPLNTDDKIIVKQKTSDVFGLPTTTPQFGARITWTSNREFYTTADLSEAKTYIDSGKELECEITSGSGAGQMSQVQEINYESGTYSVVLVDTLQGVVALDISTMQMDNWEVVTTITSGDTEGYKRVDLNGNAAKWAKFKIILDGIDGLAIEDILVANGPYRLKE